MMKKSLTQAMRPLAGMCTSSVSRSARQFSTSPAHGLRAIFSETDNADLNKVLGEIQDKIILPAQLPEKQRELIFSPKMRHFIQQNPIVIELEGLEHKFTTIDRFTEIPNSKKVFLSALELMKTKEDWDNLGTLLAGYKKAGIKLSPHHYMKIIRKAGREGQIYSIIECAKQAPRTGFVLSEKEYIVQLLAFVVEKEPAHAVGWTQTVLDLLERHPHAKETFPPRQLNIVVRGQALYAQASNARAQAELSEHELAQLKDAAKLYIRSWNRETEDGANANPIAELDPTNSQNQSRKTKAATLSPTDFIQSVAFNIKGLSLTREALGYDESVKTIEAIEQKLEAYLREFVEKSGSKYRDHWAGAYEKAMGKKPQWPVSA